TYLRGAPTETDRFLRWQDVLDGFMASSGRVGTALGASDDPRIVEPILRTARRARVVVLPTATGVDGLVRPSVNAIRALVSSKVRTAGGPIVRVVVINGSGRPGVADSLAVRLAPLGYEIVAADKQGQAVVVLDVRELITITDYFVICSGSSDRQVKTLSDEIVRVLKARGVRPVRREGEAAAKWVLLDFVDFVVHVFNREERE